MDFTELINKAYTEGVGMETIDGVGVTLRHEDGGDPEYNDLFSITLIDADTREWMFDTGDIHIDDLHSLLVEAIESGKDLEALRDTQLNNYIQYTNDHYYDSAKDKELD